MRNALRRLLFAVGTLLLVGVGAGQWEPSAFADRESDSHFEIDFGKNEAEKDRHIDASKFPTVTVRFRIIDKRTGKPAETLPSGTVVVYEDGTKVAEKQIGGGGPISAMLALDTSGSMQRDQKIERAKESAESFLDKLKPEVPCGLVLFSHRVYESSPPSREREPLKLRVHAASAEGGTAYLDATAAAVQRLADESGRKVIVLMTDGRDVNSRKYNLDRVIQLARDSAVQVYTVGLGKPGRNDPVRIVLVLDCSGSMLEGSRGPDRRFRTKFDHMKEASLRFIEFIRKDQILVDPVEGFRVDAARMTIIPFNQRVAKADDLTNNAADLRKVIDKLRAEGGTALYDATCEAMQTLNAATLREKQRLPGKGINRSVVVLTDGKDLNSGANEKDVLRLYEQTGIKVYMLGLGDSQLLNEEVMRRISKQCGGEYFHVPDSAKLTRVFEDLSIQLNDDGIDEESLQRLAEETGGRYFHVENAENLAEQFGYIAGALESYEVEYVSKRKRKDGLGRSILIQFGEYAEARTGFGLHGMLTPAYDSWIYLFFLVLLIGLIAAPMLMRRLAKPEPIR